MLEDAGATLVPRPVSVDVLLNLQAERAPWADYVDPLAPAKRAHLMSDIPRMARYWDIPLGGPFTFKPASKRAMCALTDLASSGETPDALIDRFFVTLWQEAKNIEDADVFEAVMADTGHAPMNAEAEQSALEALTSNTIAAYQSGIFGVPSFQHKDHIYFGADRMDVLSADLARAQTRP